MTDSERTYILGSDEDKPCVICGSKEYKGVQYGGKGGAIAVGDRWIHAVCLDENIRLLKCKGEVIEFISFDPLTNGWYFYNYNDEFNSWSHEYKELTYCPFCSHKLSDHPNILAIQHKDGK